MNNERFYNVLRTLKMATVNHQDSYINIKTLTKELFSKLAVPGTYLPAGTFLCRCRINKTPKLFIKIEDLSNRPDLHNITHFGRANEPHQSIFYASITKPTAILETLYQYNPDFGTHTLTIGVWKTTKPLILSSFISAEQQVQIERSCQKLGIPFDSFFSGCDGVDRQFLLKLLDFYSEKFTQQIRNNPNEYMFTAAVANIVFSTAADGLMYDSVKYPECRIIQHSLSRRPAKTLSDIEQLLKTNGLIQTSDRVNVAIRPEAVAQKLVFHDAICMTLTQIGEAEYFETETKRAISISDGKIYWSGII